MIAEPSLDLGTAAARPLGRSASDLQRCSAAMLAATLALIAMLLVWRRLAGALVQPLPPAAMLPAGVVLAGAAHGVRRLRPRRATAIFASALVVAVGASLTLPATTAVAWIGFWAVLGIEEFLAWRPILLTALRRGRAGSASTAGTVSPPTTSTATTSAATSVTASTVRPIVEITSCVPGHEVRQQLTRSQADDGSEQLCGWLRMPFAPGQRTASLHVAFCPSFAQTPKLSVEQLEGPAVRIKTAQVLPHGARFDLKLASTAESTVDVLLQFAAESPGGK